MTKRIVSTLTAFKTYPWHRLVTAMSTASASWIGLLADPLCEADLIVELVGMEVDHRGRFR